MFIVWAFLVDIAIIIVLYMKSIKNYINYHIILLLISLLLVSIMDISVILTSKIYIKRFKYYKKYKPSKFN